ncbi:hypothetical protein FDP41_003952 [Naegleria fowleri]|uniref:RecA family profile 1 domain-containing protein n=1 Tax=Naegleria fowleri TaxID=5763 RepID=A0A6A5BWK2_NAEFO|nr:uncharacterized protein FDP41_003952 [Naegleria fowleri]KAF0977299.1 hypothetical protein FDP41_003952 [Naegleria fowleri]
MSQHQTVRIELTDFIAKSGSLPLVDHHGTLVKFLKFKLRTRRLQEFSMKFESPPPNEPDQLLNLPKSCFPLNVRISYSCQCILVSDLCGERIHVFDYFNKKLKASILVGSRPRYICIEENYDEKRSDALLFNCNNGTIVYKYNLEKLLEQAMKNMNERCSNFLWKSTHPLETAKEMVTNFGKVFICNHSRDCVDILNSKNGEFLESISLNGHLSKPIGIDLTTFGDVVVSEETNRIQILRFNIDDDEWLQVHAYGSKGYQDGNHFNRPSGMIFDKTSNRILVCDTHNHRILVFAQDGTLEKSFGEFGSKRGKFFYPENISVIMISLNKKKRKLTDSQESEAQSEDDHRDETSELADDLQTQSSCSSPPYNDHQHPIHHLEEENTLGTEEYYDLSDFELVDESIPNQQQYHHDELDEPNFKTSMPVKEEEEDIDFEMIQGILSEEEENAQHQLPPLPQTPFITLNSDTSALESSSAESLENNSINEQLYDDGNSNNDTQMGSSLTTTPNESFDSQSTATTTNLEEQFTSIETMPIESILTIISTNPERLHRAKCIVQLLKHHLGIQTVQALLFSQRRFVLSIKEISNQDYEMILCAAQSLDPSCTPFGFTTASEYHYQMVSRRYHVKTGSSDLDELLAGGVESSSLTEFFGESSSGKTQICHTLAVTAQIPNEAGSPIGKVIYIDTCGSFRPERLNQISQRFKLDPKQTLDNISYSRVYNCDQQTKNVNEMRKLLNMHQQQHQQNPYRLIIIDSATGLFRTEFNRDGICERQNKLGQYLESLIKLSEDFNIPIVITNQVMDALEKPSPFHSPNSSKGSPKVKPVGGHVLAHTVTTRVQFFKELQQRRRAQIFKSSNRPELSCSFGIYGDGIDNYREYYDSY